MLRPVSIQPELDPAADGLTGVMAKSASVSALSELEVQLEAHSRKARQTTPQEFITALPGNGLFFTIHCDVPEQVGLMVVDPSLFNAIDDVLTGDLDKGKESRPRPPSAVDIALCRPYFDTMLAEFSEILQELRAGKKTDIYQTGKIAKEPSPHQFPDIPYLEIAIEFDFENGARSGHLSVMLPAANTEFTSALPRPGENAASWKAALHEAVDTAPAKLDVVLYRKKLPIGQIMGLKVGNVLEVPAWALENLSIESRKGKTSRSLMRARLGEYQEMRAAKVTQIGEEPASLASSNMIESALEPTDII